MKTAVVFVVFAMLALAGCGGSGYQSGTLPDPQSATASVTAPAAVVDIPAPENWAYSADAATSFRKALYFAETDSTTTLNFGFPYDGPQHAALILRSDGAIVITFKGQLTCQDLETTPDDCEVQVIFFEHGRKIARTYPIEMPADDSTGMFFIDSDADGEDTKAFYRRLIRSDRIAINVQFYQEGTQEVDWNTAGLDKSKTGSWFK